MIAWPWRSPDFTGAVFLAGLSLYTEYWCTGQAYRPDEIIQRMASPAGTVIKRCEVCSDCRKLDIYCIKKSLHMTI